MFVFVLAFLPPLLKEARLREQQQQPQQKQVRDRHDPIVPPEVSSEVTIAADEKAAADIQDWVLLLASIEQGRVRQIDVYDSASRAAYKKGNLYTTCSIPEGGRIARLCKHTSRRILNLRATSNR